jgi:hypothetical protein
MANLIEYIPFGAAIIATLGLTESRLAKKVDKGTFEERCLVIDRMEQRIMRIEDHFFDKPLTKREAEARVKKHNRSS